MCDICLGCRCECVFHEKTKNKNESILQTGPPSSSTTMSQRGMLFTYEEDTETYRATGFIHMLTNGAPGPFHDFKPNFHDQTFCEISVLNERQ